MINFFPMGKTQTGFKGLEKKPYGSQWMRENHTLPSDPYCSQPRYCIHSASVTHTSLGLIGVTAKLPRRAPRFGIRIFSVERITLQVWGSTCAMKRGAR